MQVLAYVYYGQVNEIMALTSINLCLCYASTSVLVVAKMSMHVVVWVLWVKDVDIAHA